MFNATSAHAIDAGTSHIPTGEDHARVASPPALQMFRATPVRRRVQPRQALFLAGQPCRSLVLVHAGYFKTAIASADGRERVTGLRMRGDVLGLESLGLDTYACDAVALDLSEVWELPVASLRGADPTSQACLSSQLAAQVRRDWNCMLATGTLTAEQRVIDFLLDLSERQAVMGFSPNTLDVRMSRAEIGSYLSLQLETVTRALSHLQVLGLISVDRRRITLVDAAALRARLHMH
jgi:CRP/FNR family transcriptional regulator